VGALSTQQGEKILWTGGEGRARSKLVRKMKTSQGGGPIPAAKNSPATLSGEKISSRAGARRKDKPVHRGKKEKGLKKTWGESGKEGGTNTPFLKNLP